MTDSTTTVSRSSSTNAASNILSEKVARALQVRTDTPAMKAALDALSRLPDAGEMDSRSVRVAIERDALTQALSLQEELQTLVNTVKQLKQGVAHVSNIAHEIARVSHQSVVSPSTTNNNDDDDGLEEELRLATLLNEAFVEQQQAKLRAETVDQFLQKFDLDPQHAAILDTFDFSDIQQDGFVFLEALDRVYKIKRELSTQNVFSDQAQHGLGASSAIRMMESLANKQERAYEKLYHWLQQYLHLNQSIQEQQHQLDPDAMDEALSHPFVRQSLRTLHHSTPAFYSHTLEMIATSRRIEVTRRFLLALTEGHGGQAPLEMKAHDPVSYVGDMLAFCFQACSVEADNVRHIVVSVSEPEEEKEEYSVQDDQPTMTAEEMLGHATSGISRPLKSRILQVISSLARKEQDEDEDEAGFEEEEEGAIARSRVSSLYNICGLLVYYRSALLKCANKDESNPLVVAIMDCLKEGTEGFAASLRVYAAMLDSLSMVTGEAETLLAQLMLGQLVEIRTTSPGFAVHVDCPKELQPSLSLDFITSILVEAALSSCTTLDDAVTLKGCISTAKKAGLVSYQHLESLVAEKERAMIDELVEEKTAQVLEVCGLGCMATAWKNMLTGRRTDDSNSNRQTDNDIITIFSTLITAALTMTTKIPAATLYALVRAYVEARNTNSHIVLFASTTVLPDPVKEIIRTFGQRYYMEGLRFSHDGKELTPDDITVDGGSLLATYIHSLGSYTVMLASICQHILEDDYLKKDFVAELPPGVELSQRAWRDQKSVIKNVVSNYIMDHIICPLHEDRENLIDQTRILGDLNQDLTKKLNEIDVENGELRRDIEDLGRENEALGRENTYLQQCITSLEEEVAELEEEKENAPLTSKVLELLKQEEDVNVSMSKSGATVQVKSQKTPAKPKKTPRRAQFARTPAPVSNLHPSTPAPATSPREDID